MQVCWVLFTSFDVPGKTVFASAHPLSVIPVAKT
jgi:hypothetical protein